MTTMAAAIDQAAHFVHIEFYIMAWDDQTAPVFEALVRRHGRGVRVRMLFDHLGTRSIPRVTRTSGSACGPPTSTGARCFPSSR